MIAIEAKYHNRCLCALYNRARLASPMDNDGVEACMHGIAFAELVVFLENASSDGNSLLSSDPVTLLNCIRTDWTILESLWIAEFIAPDLRTGLWPNFPSLGLIEREEHASHISEEHWVSFEKGL